MKIEGKYLITTDNWFVAPDGKMYQAVWGNAKIFDDNSVLGIKTNARSANWYVMVGSTDNHVIVAGCQIHYACKCDKKPDKEMINRWSSKDKKFHPEPSRIYLAE